MRIGESGGGDRQIDGCREEDGTFQIQLYLQIIDFKCLGHCDLLNNFSVITHDFTG